MKEALKLIAEIAGEEARLLHWERWFLENIGYRIAQREPISEEDRATLQRIKERVLA